MTRLRHLRRDRAGVTAVEFALVAPIIITLICGAIEMGNLMFARIMLEGAVVDAARVATASLESSQSERDTAMRTKITAAMRMFPIAPGRAIAIETRVYRDFSSAYPEAYQDRNGNRQYDLGEPYTDRNQNGRWDNATPIPNKTTGGAGDVLSITARYPRKLIFGYLGTKLGFAFLSNLSATTVVRNEAVERTTS